MSRPPDVVLAKITIYVAGSHMQLSAAGSSALGELSSRLRAVGERR